MMETENQRTLLLMGEESLERLKQACVMVVGIGGVGSYCAEALARCGVGTLILLDGDCISPSNLNRQIHATYETIGQPKTEVMKQRILSYQKNCMVDCHHLFYDKTKNEQLFTHLIDMVVDAIDTISSKLDLIEACKEYNVPFISSMGMANRMNPSAITITDLMKTSYDPLAKVMRHEVRKRGIKGKIPVVASFEHPIIQHIVVNEQGKTRKEKMPPASSPFVPAAAGLACASYVVQTMTKEKQR